MPVPESRRRVSGLDHRLRQHYQRVVLSRTALDRLRLPLRSTGLAEEGPDPLSASIPAAARSGWAPIRPVICEPGMIFANRRKAWRKTWRRMWVWALAAPVLASLLLGVLAVLMHNTASLDERWELTVREVAMNHVTRLALEFEGDSIASLNAHMQLLPFELAVPERLPKGLDVVGSRYCSLAGQLAAYVKLRDADTGLSLSLVITSMGAELKALQDDIEHLDGVQVELFREGGLVYALARQPA